jgi:hypothetical protein
LSKLATMPRLYARTCAWCGKGCRLTRPEYRLCSRECVNAWNRERRPPTLASCAWCCASFKPTHYHGGGGPKRPQRSCSRACSDALKREGRSRKIWPCMCGKTMLHGNARRVRCSACPRSKREKRIGKPVVKFCLRGCGRADILPAKQGPWSCEDCKALYAKSGKTRWREREGRISPLLRDAVLERDNWRCQLCGGVIPRGQTDTNAIAYPNIDHIVPSSLGGPTTLDNLQASHRMCNMRKGATNG